METVQVKTASEYRKNYVQTSSDLNMSRKTVVNTTPMLLYKSCHSRRNENVQFLARCEPNSESALCLETSPVTVLPLCLLNFSCCLDLVFSCRLRLPNFWIWFFATVRRAPETCRCKRWRSDCSILFPDPMLTKMSSDPMRICCKPTSSWSS